MIIRNLKFAWESILEGKTKAILSVLSIAISVITMIIILSISNGLYNYIVEQFKKTGTDLMWVQADSPTLNANKSMTMQDVKNIENLSFIKLASPSYMKSETIYMDSNSANVSICGVNDSFANIANKQTIGRFISMDDEVLNAAVCVISNDVRKKFVYKNINPIGEQINISGIYYTIIGYFEPSDTDSDFSSNIEKTNAIYIPYTIFQKNYNSSALNLIFFTVKDESRTDEYKGQIKVLFNGLISSGTNISIEGIQDSLNEWLVMIKKINIFFVIFIIVTMLISGIGIMNVLLMSAMEKKWEIGLRKSIGASRFDILFQFLSEIVIISAIGIIVGVMIAIEFVTVLTTFESSMRVSFNAIVLSVVFCLLIALIFGITPAWKASKLLPLDCLKKE